MSKVLFAAGCLLGATGAAFGAIGAHAMKRIVSDVNKLKAWETAANYQLIHTIPILFAAQSPNLTCGGWITLAGTCLFSGSIYLLVIRPGWRFLGPVTPLGGVLMIAGWSYLAYQSLA